jgi:hypothetical protein
LVILEENMVVAQFVHRNFENKVAKFVDVVNACQPATFKIKRKFDGVKLSQQPLTSACHSISGSSVRA